MSDDLTERPVLVRRIEDDAHRLLKEWGNTLECIRDVMQNSRTFLAKWGRQAAIQALGDKAQPIASAYLALKAIVANYTDAGEQPDL